MIRVESLSKTYDAIHAVRKIDFTANTGEIFGLLGPNGAGKTTTLRMLYGIVKPTTGNIFYNGLSMQTHTRELQARIGALTDGGSLYTRLTAKENIQYFANLHQVKTSVFNARLDELCERLSMESILNRKTHGFSQGERMKVSLSRALIHDPDYIFLDEPTNGLDVQTTQAVRSLLLELKKRGKCIIFSSHLMHEVTHLCDRIAIVANGILSNIGTIDEIVADSKATNLEEAFIHFAYQNSGDHLT